jgi:DNA repair protein RadC
LRQFLPRRKAEPVGAALSIFAIAETEHALSEQLDNPESIYKACADMKLLNQEVLRVILLNTRYRHSSTVEISRGTINESLAHAREIFRPVIAQSAYAFVLVHNHPSGETTPSESDVRLTRRLSEAARILQINMLDHVIVGRAFGGRDISASRKLAFCEKGSPPSGHSISDFHEEFGTSINPRPYPHAAPE